MSIPTMIRIAVPVVSLLLIGGGVVWHHLVPNSLTAAFVIHTGYFGAVLGVVGLLLEAEGFRIYFEDITRRMLESIIRTVMMEHAFLLKMRKNELQEIRRRSTRAQFTPVLHEKCDEVLRIIEDEIFEKLDGPHYEEYKLFLDHKIVECKGIELIEATQTVRFKLVSADPSQGFYTIEFSHSLDKIADLKPEELLFDIAVSVEGQNVPEGKEFFRQALR